ncbi:MAG: hypothetical protein OXI17_12120 [Gammaproteobacteria bacterium]|nr:hypothetical protein [Gammaproteobacteria bacterium]
MAYVDPNTVISPKNHWRLLNVLYEDDEDGWSVAEGQWEHGGRWSDVLAIRWNGSPHAKLGHPQSRGLPTWFIIPEGLEEVIRERVDELKKAKIS